MILLLSRRALHRLVFVAVAIRAGTLAQDGSTTQALNNTVTAAAPPTDAAPPRADVTATPIPQIVSLQLNQTPANNPPPVVSLQNSNATMPADSGPSTVQEAAAPVVNTVQNGAAGPILQSVGGVAATTMPLQLVSSLLQPDGTLDLSALIQHINSISAKLSARVESRDDANAPHKLQRRAGGDTPPTRPRQQCTNRGIGRESLQAGSDRRAFFEGELTPFVRGSWQASELVRRQDTTRKAPPANASTKAPPAKTTPAPVATPAQPPGGEVDGCRGGNFFWSTPMKVGRTMIQAIIDTGSSLTIVDGKLYDAKGATYVKKNFTIDFVDGSAAGGHVFEDTVNVANVNFINSTVCRDEKGFNLDNAASYGLRGLIGLQRPGYAMKSAGIGGLLDRVRHILEHNLFSLTLTPSRGDMFLGGFDPIVAHKDWVMVPVVDDPEGHWVVPASVNEIAMPKHVVVDSGTSSMLFDHDVAQSVLEKMPVVIVTVEKMLLGVFKCDTPPRITIRIGDFSKLLRPETSLLGNVNSTHCYASVVGVPRDTKLSQSAILGGPFFTNTYVGFDFANGRMAFHPQP